MNILMVASEATPYAKTGGLADVLGALPAALAEQGQRVAVVLPAYRGNDYPQPVREAYRNLWIPLGPGYRVNVSDPLSAPSDRLAPTSRYKEDSMHRRLMGALPVGAPSLRRLVGGGLRQRWQHQHDHDHDGHDLQGRIRDEGQRESAWPAKRSRKPNSRPLPKNTASAKRKNRPRPRRRNSLTLSSFPTSSPRSTRSGPSGHRAARNNR